MNTQDIKITNVCSSFSQHRGHTRRGSSLVEALLLILIVAIVLVGFFDSIAAAMRLRLYSQVDLDNHVLANSCFMALDSRNTFEFFSKDTISSGYRNSVIVDNGSLNIALDDIMRQMGGTKHQLPDTTGAVNCAIGSVNLTFSIAPEKDKVLEQGYSEVTLAIDRQNGRGAQTFTHTLNAYNSSPASSQFVGGLFKQRAR